MTAFITQLNYISVSAWLKGQAILLSHTKKNKIKPIAFYETKITLIVKTNFTACLNHTDRKMNWKLLPCGGGGGSFILGTVMWRSHKMQLKPNIGGYTRT